MTLAAIEAELDNLTLDELRWLAGRSWTAFLIKKGTLSALKREDPVLSAALEEAISRMKPAIG